jgi:3-methyladenine DNA glycosylase/8-oxoguanine DNA glycosylase
MSGRIVLKPRRPYNLALSLRAASRFSPDGTETPDVYRAAVWLGGRPSLMEARERDPKPLALEATFKPASAESRMLEAAEWILHTDLDLRPFYRKVREHAVLGPTVKVLRGLVAMRTPSLFVMAVIAITEQQISLAAASPRAKPNISLGSRAESSRLPWTSKR